MALRFASQIPILISDEIDSKEIEQFADNFIQAAEIVLGGSRAVAMAPEIKFVAHFLFLFACCLNSEQLTLGQDYCGVEMVHVGGSIPRVKSTERFNKFTSASFSLLCAFSELLTARLPACVDVLNEVITALATDDSPEYCPRTNRSWSTLHCVFAAVRSVWLSSFDSDNARGQALATALRNFHRLLFWTDGKFSTASYRITGLRLMTNNGIPFQKSKFAVLFWLILLRLSLLGINAMSEIRHHLWLALRRRDAIARTRAAREWRTQQTHVGRHHNDDEMAPDGTLSDGPMLTFHQTTNSRTPTAQGMGERERREGGTTRLKCLLCIGRVRFPPASTPCGHIFCWECVVGWGLKHEAAEAASGRGRPARCPACRQSFKVTAIRALYNYG